MNLETFGQAIGWVGGCLFLLTQAEGALRSWRNARRLERMLAELDVPPMPRPDGRTPVAARPLPEGFRPHHVIETCTGCGERVVTAHPRSTSCPAPWPEFDNPILGHVHRPADRPAPPLSRVRPSK